MRIVMSFSITDNRDNNIMTIIFKYQIINSTSSNFRKSTLQKKWSFPLKIFSVNVTKSAGDCGFGHIYWKNPKWKTSFFHFCAVQRPVNVPVMEKFKLPKMFSFTFLGYSNFPGVNLGNAMASICKKKKKKKKSWNASSVKNTFIRFCYKLHYVNYARIRVFSDPYSPI